MSPPTPVRTREDVRRQYRDQLENPERYQCVLKSLSQLECTFKISENNSVQETICVPFKRLFQRCLDPYTITKDGKKINGKRWINIEITDSSTNDSVNAAHGAEIQRFLQAEIDLAKWMELQTEQQD